MSRLAGLKGKRAVVTGGASGLGRELCLELARRGWRLGVVDIDGEGCRETIRMVESTGGSGEAIVADVGRPEEVEALAEHFFGSFGGVDLLVNCAGVAAMGIFEDIPLEDWHWVMRANLFGVVHTCREFVPRMKAQGAGHVLNIASIAGQMSQAEYAPYGVSKAGVISLSETMRVELAGSGVGVTVACPIYFQSNLALRCTDPWQNEYFRTALSRGRMRTSQVAAAAIRGVDRNRLYVVPQTSAKLLLAIKRFAPATWFGLESLLNRLGMLRWFTMFLSRHRML